LNAKFFFAHPYASWERGAIENTNGLIRHYFPKGMDFNLITKEAISFATRRLNHRPRKCLGRPRRCHRVRRLDDDCDASRFDGGGSRGRLKKLSAIKIGAHPLSPIWLL
jgi:hypothetical protein